MRPDTGSRRSRVALGLSMSLMLAAPAVEALEVTLTAQYRGGAGSNFENTTPVSQYCLDWPASCTDRKLVDFPTTYVKEVTNGGPRDRYHVKVPGRRTVDVFHESTGEPHSLVFEINGVGGKVASPNNDTSPVYALDLQGPCTRLGSAAVPRSYVRYLWSVDTPGTGAVCHSIYRRAKPDYFERVTVTLMGIAYNLTTPQPYRMKPGIYRGSVTYTVGPGGDFDFGDAVSELNGNSVTVNFVLDVEHLFLLNFPPGSDRAVLEPAGGWMAWLNGGRVPQRLYRDLPMQVWSTGPIRVYKLCEHDVGSRCGIRNDLDEDVPVRVALSLPEGMRYRGNPVQRLELPTGRAAALQFESVMPAINRPGALHFDVAREDVKPMLDRPGKTYDGKVTVIFDAEI